MHRAPVLLVFVTFIAIGAFCQNTRIYRQNISRDIKRNDDYYDEKVEEYKEKKIIEMPRYYVERRDVEKVSVSRDERYIPICCPPGHYLSGPKCKANDTFPASELEFPPIYDSSLSISEMRPEDFIPKYGLPCDEGDDMHPLLSAPLGDDIFHLLENGTIHHDYSNTDYDDAWYNLENYCWASVKTRNGSMTVAAVCFGYSSENKEKAQEIFILKPISMILSLPFLVATFAIYSILPELKTMHGSTLKTYVACLFFAYVALITVQLGDEKVSGIHSLCISIAFVIHFSFLASFFWLNVMCFDIWWTFGGFRSLQGSVKQRERKKFIIYSVYAWGSASLITGVCLIMDFVPSVPRNFIRPEFGVGSCWFNTDAARAIYFYGPMGVTVACNICLFISTAIKIIQHKKDTAHHLKGMDSRRHDDNKQWFNLYLKLFIVMGINWSMEIISWLCKDSPQYVWYITDLANTLQGVIIFVIFVWKDKIKRLLQKRLGCQNRSFRSRNSTKSAYHSSASRTCTTTAVTAPLQEKSNPYSERTKITTDESDCV